jgi:hypothetical protein
MTKKSNTPCFDLETVRDLFRKAERDFAAIDDCMNSDDLFNFLCTTNHLAEWCVDDVRTAAKQLQAQSTELDLIRKLCNRSKHFEKKPVHPNTVVESGFGVGRFGKGGFGVGEPSYVVRTDSGQEMNILDLARASLEAWRCFLAQRGLI